MSDSLQPHELPSRLLCPWNSPDKNTRVGSHSFSRESSWPRVQTLVSCITGRFFTLWAIREALMWGVVLLLQWRRSADGYNRFSRNSGGKKYCRFINTYLLAQEYHSWKTYILDIKTHTCNALNVETQEEEATWEFLGLVWGIGERVQVNRGNLSSESLCTGYPAEDLGRWPRCLGKNNKLKRSVWGTLLFVVKQKAPKDMNEYMSTEESCISAESQACSALKSPQPWAQGTPPSGSHTGAATLGASAPWKLANAGYVPVLCPGSQ